MIQYMLSKDMRHMIAILTDNRGFWVCRSKKMGTRTIAYQDGQVVFFKAVMDNALGKYLNAGLPDTSGKYNDRVVRNEGKITGFLDEVQGQTAYQSFAQKIVKNRVQFLPDYTTRHVKFTRGVSFYSRLHGNASPLGRSAPHAQACHIRKACAVFCKCAESQLHVSYNHRPLAGGHS